MQDGLDALPDPIPAPSSRAVLRAALGGSLMGLANLVPGISGGTMLLAAGVYTGFITAIAELTTLRFRWRSLLLLGVVAGAAALAIASLAGPIKELVVERRWIMYSLFIGLTLGGVPLVWRLAQPPSRSVWISATAAFAVMALMAFASPAGAGGERSAALAFVSGLAGASAMILPGISGGYLLLLLGQYITILDAIDDFKVGLLATADAIREGVLSAGAALGSQQFAPALDALGVLIPLGVGVVIGVVGVSNAVRWLLQHHAHPTLGALLGLLLGAVVGLWPFQEGVAPQPGDTLKGALLSAEAAAEVEPEDWPVVVFRPTAGQAAASLGLVGLGLLATLGVARIGRDDDTESQG